MKSEFEIERERQLETVSAKRLHTKLDLIELDEIPVMSNDRSIPRKEQAALARQLVKSLGISEVRFTVPVYSMASSVYVRFPKRYDVQDLTASECDARARNWNAEQKIGAILDTAFPNHKDRSDSQSDHFDFCWSFR